MWSYCSRSFFLKFFASYVLAVLNCFDSTSDFNYKLFLSVLKYQRICAYGLSLAKFIHVVGRWRACIVGRAVCQESGAGAPLFL